jgi:hypothetical protein
MKSEKKEGSGMSTKSKRRFDLGPSRTPLIQSVCATVPLAILLLYFSYEAYARPSRDCSTNPESVQDDQLNQQIATECSHLIALGDMVVVCVCIALFWATLAVYLIYYVPRRHALVAEYLTSGITIIGDVFYTPRKTLWCGNLSSRGTVVYPHPNRDLPVMLQRPIYVYEKFTRERTALLYLPDQPCSAQSKTDLQIDYDVAQLNMERLHFLRFFSVAWLTFSLICGLFILLVLMSLDTNAEDGLYWLPDYGQNYALIVFVVFAVFIIPVGSLLSNVVAFYIHKYWMVSKHNILQEGDPVNPSGCAGFLFDDDDCEAIEYQPSSTSSHKFRRMNDR